MRALFILATAFIIMGCPDKEDPIDSMLILNNLSNQSIVYSIEVNPPSDTTLASISYPLSPANINEITLDAMESDTISESFIKMLREDFKDRILIVFFLSKDTIDQVPWERIRAENLVLRRYDLTLEDLEALNWTIEYP